MLLSSVAAARWTRSGDTAAYLKLPEDIDDNSSSESRFRVKYNILFGNKWSKFGLTVSRVHYCIQLKMWRSD